MLSVDRFTVVLDACSLFPMVVRDVLLTFADHEFYAPKWSARIHEEWTRNLIARFAEKSAANDAVPKIAAIRSASRCDRYLQPQRFRSGAVGVHSAY